MALDESFRLDLRCATHTRAAGIEPIGTAGSYAGYLLVEWPLPWPRDLGEIPELGPINAACRAARWRLQGLVAEGGPRHVIAYGTPGGAWRRYLRSEITVGAADTVDAALELLQASTRAAGEGAPAASAPAGIGTGEGGGAENGSAERRTAEPDDKVRDLLICSHGRRDRCCGSFGTALVSALTAGDRAGGGRAGRAAGVRVWRTSHTGGHRFAPTAILLPEGTSWGLLDGEAVGAILERREPAAAWLKHYRGCSGLASPELQLLERAALDEIGWDVLDAARLGSASPGEDGWTQVRLVCSWPGGRRAEFSAEVGVERLVPIPDCGQPVEQGGKTERQLGLRRFSAIA